MSEPAADFSRRVVRWQAVHGRNQLPWQNTRDPYRVWLSEVMLQQTQVATVLSYYPRFLARFPEIAETHCLTDELEFVVEIETESGKTCIDITGRA